MLTRIDPLGSICKQIFNARCYHRLETPKQTAKDRFKEKQKSEESKYFIKEHAEKLKTLHLAMQRLERRQKKLQAEMDEAEKMLLDLLPKDKKAQ